MDVPPCHASTVPAFYPCVETATYVPRGRNPVQRILEAHFPAFEACYDERYADDYGRFRLERISHAVTGCVDCGDWSKGIAASAA